MATAAGGVRTGMFQSAQDVHRVSSAYIPTEGLPGWLRTVAGWNPFSAVATALRDLFGNAPVPQGAAWPVTHPVAGSLAWCAVLLAVFVPLAVREYAHGRS